MEKESVATGESTLTIGRNGKKHRQHLVFPILPSELKTLDLTQLPEGVDIGGLIFTRYEIEQALRRWQHHQQQDPLKHPSRSAYVKQCLETQKRLDVAIRQMRVAHQKLQDAIEVAKTDIVCKITEKAELQQGIQHEIALRKHAEREQKISADLIKAQQRKLDIAAQQAQLLHKTIERYEIRYRTLRSEYPLNWLQRCVGWLFRIC